MVICNKCLQYKHEHEYYNNKKICKECYRKQSKVNYYKDPAKRISVKKEYVRKKQEFVYDYLLEHPCVDCGECNPIVLEFDHVRGYKLFDISYAIQSSSLEKLIEEIRKCEVRCSNCHAKRTACDRNTYAYVRYTLEELNY